MHSQSGIRYPGVIPRKRLNAECAVVRPARVATECEHPCGRVRIADSVAEERCGTRSGVFGSGGIGPERFLTERGVPITGSVGEEGRLTERRVVTTGEVEFESPKPSARVRVPRVTVRDD